MEWRRPLAKLEYGEYSWSTEKSHTPAILSGCGGLFTLRESRRGHTATTNFERSVTPRTSVRSPPNFGKTRFGRFAKIDFFSKFLTFFFFFNFFRTKIFSFSQFSVVFGGSGQFLTSESTSLSNFASDRPIHSSLQPLEQSVGQWESRKSGPDGQDDHQDGD